MTDGPRQLRNYDGVWLSDRDTPVDPDAPGFGAGCELQDGYRLVIELFYNPEDTLRFGTDTFGEHLFGQYDGAPPSVSRWVDLTPYCLAGVIDRGNLTPTVEDVVDQFTFDLLDPTADIIDWKPGQSLSSPTVNTPCRVGYMTANGQYSPAYMGLITKLSERHGDGPRTVMVETYGTRSDLASRILNPDRPKETVQQRIEWVLTEIGWAHGYDPTWPNPGVDTVELDVDQQFDYAITPTAIQIIRIAAYSAGYRVSINKSGQFRLLPIVGDQTPVPPAIVVADCEDARADVVAVAYDIVADVSELLNVVQIRNQVNPDKSAEAIDPISVGRWGRRTNGFGFPITTQLPQTGDNQALADAVLAVTANLVVRVATVTLNTRSDPRWWDAFAVTELGSTIEVLRVYPTEATFTCQVIGYTLLLNEYGYIEGTLNLLTTDPYL